MKRFLLTMMVLMIPGLVSVSQAWTLLDDFDSYDNSANTRTTIATGGVWASVFDGTANSNVIDYEDGQVLQTLGGAAWRGAKRDLTGTGAAVLVGQVKTFFWQVKCSYTGAETTAWVYDFMMGLAPNVSNIDDIDAWQDFSVMPYINNAPTTPFINANAPISPWWAPMSPDTWTNVWVVIDNNAADPTFDLYYSTGDDDPELVITDADWRNFAGNVDLNAIGFMAAGAADTEFLVNNIYYTDGVSLSIPVFEQGAVPWGPAPANNQENYGDRDPLTDTVTAELQWKTGLDPNDPDVYWDQILVHYLYLSADQAVSNDANLYYVEAIPAVGETGEYTLTGLNFDGWYLWQVEEGINDGTDNPYPAGDPNNFMGPVWAFGSRQTRPSIITHPANVLADVDDAVVSFTVVAESISDLEYQWYKALGRERDEENDVAITTLDAANDVLELTDIALSDEGYYYSKIVNVGDEQQELAVFSNIARLGVRRQVAYWTLDQTDYVGSQYLDISGEGNHADPNGVPAFVDGQVGDSVQISRVSGSLPTTDSWARAGTWNPSEYSDQLTVSFWLKWDGVNGTYQSFISKRSGDWNNAEVLWQVSTNSNGTRLHLESPRGNIGLDAALADAEDQWVHIAAVTNGATAAVYLNGEQIGSGNFQFGDAVDAMINLGGNSFDNNPREWMNGALDDVRIYNYVKSEMDIALMFLADADEGSTACIQSLRPDAMFDLNGDCKVDIQDIVMFAADWLECGLVPDCLP